MHAKEDARLIVEKLVRNFQNDPDRHKHVERQLAERYILPLFRALGWDTETNDMTAEEQISRGRVDYGFYVQGVPQFYLETKRADKQLDDIKRMKQAINYAYLKGVTWAVLTDFDRLMVFNADLEEDEPSKARLIDLKVDMYLTEFDDLWLLSKSAIQTRPRSIDTLAERYGKKARREPITQVLFNDLADWRRALFEDIRTHKPLDCRLPNQAVDNAIQKFFDRLIFLRTLEDRQVEKPRLKNIVRQHPQRAFDELLRQFRELDTIYNSNLFAPHALDDLTLYDPDLVKQILNGLYGRFGVEYDFSLISADVLGAVYEQYLSFKATDLAEARKSKTTKSAKRTNKRNNQGIYYTPQYIVRHIVQTTLTPILERMGKDAHAITVVDPACGSGAFLIEVFDVLDRHFAQLDPTTPSRERRERILLHNIYGVDLDEQAVEVTRLNLVLRAAHERQKLPMLSNIQRGNSLVEADEVAGARLGFSWEKGFPLVMERGGFDVVVGNPPYVRQEYLPAQFKEYALTHYTTANGTADLYVYFVERGFSLLKEGGRLGYILPNKWLRAKYGQNLRGYLADKVEQVIDFGDLPVFADATTYPLIMTLQRSTAPLPSPTTTHAETLPTHPTELLTHHLAPFHAVPRTRLTAKQWELGSDQHANLLDKLKRSGQPLGEYVNGAIYYGIKTGYNEAFVIDSETRKKLIDADPRSAEVIKPLLRGRDIKRWKIDFQKQYLLFIRPKTDIDQYPAVKAHLLKHYDALSKKAGGNKWYELQTSVAYYEEFEKPKIVYPDISKTVAFTIDTGNYFVNDTTFMIPTNDYFLLGILNSKVTLYFFNSVTAIVRGGFLRFKNIYVSQIPIPNAPEAVRERIRQRVTQIMQTQTELEQLDTSKSQNLPEQEDLRRRIREYETLLNEAVCAAYGLTAEEIGLLP